MIIIDDYDYSQGNSRNPPDELESDFLSVQEYILYVFRITDI
jgi:hypothetical protein